MTGIKLSGIFMLATAGAGVVAQADPGYLTSLAKDAPYALAFVLVVYLFITHLNSRDKRNIAAAQARDEIFNARAQECHEIQKESIEAILKNSEVNAQTIEVLRELRSQRK